MTSQNKTSRPASRKSRAAHAKQSRGSWFELIVLIFMLGAFYVMGALVDSSWTGMQGRLMGKYLRDTWGIALFVPLLFLVYLCAAWFAKGRIPRPLGQIVGTLQLYLTTAFVLGLVREARLALPWINGEPGAIGTGLAKFFMLNLGALGAIIIAFASLALAAILFGFKLPVYILQIIASCFMERKERKPEMNGKAPAPKAGGGAPPKFSEDSPPAEEPIKPAMSSAPLDGLVIVGEELVSSPGFAEETPVQDVFAAPQPELLMEEENKTEEVKKTEETANVSSVAGITETPEPAEPQPQRSAMEILDELLASLETESPLTATSGAQREAGEEEAQPGGQGTEAGVSGALLTAERSREPQSLIKHAETGEKAVKPALLPPQANDVRSPDWLEGISSAVQEEFPDVALPEDDGTLSLRKGLFPPPIDIFGAAAQTGDHDDGRALAEQQANTIVETLQNFGVKANVAHIVIGPSVIQFQLELAPGIKVSKVSGLANDLTMALAVVSVRVEAPILGQRYVGIEIPNPKRKGITLRAVMESEEFQNRDCILPLPMGVRVDSKHLICGLEDMPHLLVAGTTGSGKSVFMNTCILGMCSQLTPDELQLILVDPKHVEFAIYEGLPHLLARPVSDPKKAISALTWAVQEMEMRSEAFAKTKVRNLASYNEKVLPKNRYPHIVVVVDELADLMYTAGKEVEGLIARLAQKARAAGIHLILATQRPSVDVITGLIKANVPARVAFAVPSQTDSRTIIDTGGAEKLLGKGDMLFYSTRYPRPLRLQAAFITEERTLEFVEYMKNAFGESDYIEFEDTPNGNGASNGERAGGSIADDPKMEEAIKIIMDTGIASASGLQRYLNIGYPRAGRLISGLEQLGIVGPQPAGSKPRDILTDEDGALDILERARGGEE